jgi:YHS domain-containing protein
MERDPICGMEVDPAKSLKSTYEGKDYYFCSQVCKMTFDEEPMKFAHKENPSDGSEG